jgi:D-arabinose 1-dehydrogenase-like Zn-dependent alcohol dehydrogenase
MVQVARLYGADVVALDAADAKLAYLHEEFCVDTVNSADFDAVRLPADWDDRADVVIDLLRTRSSLTWAFHALGLAGRLVLLTTFPGIDFAACPRDLVFSQSQILGSRYASRWDLDLAAQFVESGKVRPVVSRTVELTEVETIHEDLRQGTLLGRGAVNLTR